jgi:carnosine N-methyltransferase
MSCCHGHGGHDHHLHEDIPDEEEIEEMNHFKEIVESFAHYRRDCVELVNGDNRTQTAVDVNARLTARIVEISAGLFGNDDLGETVISENLTAPRNISKVRSTIKQFVREWSKEGEGERKQSFASLIEGLRKHLPITDESNRPFIVCPGSGLGRLPYELAKAGYNAQGNEFSYHMILGSYWLLNCGESDVPIFPFALNFSNTVGEKSRLRMIKIPDEVPTSTQGQMSMCAGEFVEVYEKQGLGFADGVVTCFFIDTAKNIMLYIRTIAGMIRTGGCWANLGPLLFHYAEQDDQISIELSWEEIKILIEKYFDIIEEEFPKKCIYSGNQDSLMATEYHCVYFVARRNDRELEGFSNPVF